MAHELRVTKMSENCLIALINFLSGGSKLIKISEVGMMSSFKLFTRILGFKYDSGNVGTQNDFKNSILGQRIFF